MSKRLFLLFFAVFCLWGRASAVTYSFQTSSGHTLWYEIISYTDASNAEARIVAGSNQTSLSGNLEIPNSVYNEIVGRTIWFRNVANYAFSYCSDLTSITFQSGMRNIGDGAFTDCSGLTSITIPSTVTSIGEFAFAGCTGLTSLNIPASVTSISPGITSRCYNLASITVAAGNQTYDSRNNSNAIISSSTNTLVAGCKNSTIPNTVTRIADYAFHVCLNLTAITIPSSVTSIGEMAFSEAYGLTSITIPESVASIGEKAFYNCSSLTSVTVEATNVPTIVENAFAQRDVGSGSDIYPTRTLIVPCTMVEAYRTATGWSHFTTIQEAGGCSTFDLYVTLSGNNATVYSTTNGYDFRQRVTVSGDLTNLVIPETVTVNGTPRTVTAIGDRAFLNNTTITSVTIPGTVTNIGDHAFDGCTGLQTLALGESVTAIGEQAFSDCITLTSLVLPNSVSTMGNGAFRGCNSLANLTIGSSLTAIPSNAFASCTNLTSVSIPSTVTSIGASAFQGCTRLASINIPSSVTSIGDMVFNSCTSLSSIVIPNSITSIGNNWFLYCSNLVSVTIPSSVTSIGDYAFSNCTRLTTLTIPSSVTSLGYGVFSNSNRLSSINIPEGVTTLKSYLFYGCNSLSSITIPSTVTEIQDNAFKNCNGLSSITCLAGPVPTTATTAFDNCPTSIPVYVPSNYLSQYISHSVWRRFTNINGICTGDYWLSVDTYNTAEGNVTGQGSYPCGSEVTIEAIPNTGYQFSRWNDDNTENPRTIVITGDNAPYIAYFESISGNNLFYVLDANNHHATVYGTQVEGSVPVQVTGNDFPSNLEIPETIPYGNDFYTVTTIGSRAFYDFNGKTEITNVVIPITVTSISDRAFYGCNNIANITIPSSVTSIGTYAFPNVNSYDRKYYYLGSIDQWCAINFSTDHYAVYYGSLMINDESVTNINITNATAINSYAFQNFKNLQSVSLGSSISSIGISAFEGCSNLNSIQVDEHNATFDSRDNCNAIIETSTNTLIVGTQNSVIPNTVTAIGDYAFRSQSYIRDLDIPNSVTSIGAYAFANCSGLTNLVIPNSVTSIGGNAFFFCSRLTSVTIPNSVTSIGNSAFYYCRGLTSVTIGNSVTSIGSQAFSDCSGLTSVTIPNSVTNIGSQAFYSCSGLTSVTIGNSVTSIGFFAFTDCSGLTSVTIPNSVTNIGTYAFYGCSQLTIFDLSNINNFTRTSHGTHGTVKRVVKCSNHGIGENAIHQIPNTFSVVPSEDDVETHIPTSLIPTNFIYSNDNGETWLAKNIVLTDGQDEFNAPVEFTADNATYTRTFTDGKRSTLCLPFHVEKPAGLDVYTFADYNSSTQTIRFQELQGNKLTAYTPYLVGYGISQAKTNCEIIQENALFPATPSPIATSTINGLTFHGTMERECMNSTNYGYKDGYFVQSSAGTQGDHTSHAHVNPFRCYFTLSGSQSVPATLSVDTDGDYLGIEEVDGNMEQTAIRYSNDVYDMMGRLVRKNAESLRGLPKGIYIWRGKKQIAY